MNIADLTTFCQTWGELSQPFQTNGFVYATDRHLAVRIPVEHFEGPLPENGTRNVARYAESLDKCFNADPRDQYSSYTLHNFDYDLGEEPCTHCEGEGKLYACDECGGKGEVYHSTNYHDYENECESCNGKGYFAKSQWEEEFWRKIIDQGDTVECEECGGTGLQKGNPNIYIGELIFQGKLLKKFMQFEGAVVFTKTPTSVSSIHKPALIKWSKGEGVLMPVLNRK